ncbi:hypothetical protein CEP54_014059 [Fusarium duplospermum]|uniref:Uncharacterized protein n=1 Tax=Fusarium duplospermum TaxID=1325734 RepID=A0A428NZ13_9HYPO|nr:hypothetical protein CEP54_014059 [Fusarium duplospermum]
MPPFASTIDLTISDTDSDPLVAGTNRHGRRTDELHQQDQQYRSESEDVAMKDTPDMTAQQQQLEAQLERTRIDVEKQ